MGWLTGPIAPREKGWSEELFDEIQSLSVKQTLGLPLSAPLTFGAGALSGLSFGMFDLTDELHGGLGEFSLPKKITTSLEVAGEIGGSFVPYIGASSVASKLYKSMSLGAKMARGSFTFAAPEAIRQLVAKELDPLGAGRSLSTGALFALPRKYAAPLILGSELALGAEPEEAAVAAAFGALFAGGGKLRNREIPTKDPSAFVKTPVTGALPSHGPIGRPTATTSTAGGVSFAPEVGVAPGGKISFEARIPGIAPEPLTGPAKTGFTGAPSNVYSELAMGPGITSQRSKEAASIGQLELPIGKPKTQLEHLDDLQKAPNLTPAQKTQASMYTAEVKSIAHTTPPEVLSAQMVNTIKTKGGASLEASMLRHAQAEQQGLVVPREAPMVNSLINHPKKMGVDLMEPGQSNPYDIKAAAEEVYAYMRAQGPAGELKAAQLQQKIEEVSLAMERARASGKKKLPPSEEQRLLRQIAEIEKSLKPSFKEPDSASKVAHRQLNEADTVEQVDDFVRTLPEAYRELPEPTVRDILKQAAGRRDFLAKEPIVPVKEVYRKIHGDASPERMELHRRASDAGATLVTKRTGSDATHIMDPATGKIFSRRSETGRRLAQKEVGTFGAAFFDNAGHNIKDFKTMKEASKWLDDLEKGNIEPKNVHELRLLGNTRAIKIDYSGADLHITNQHSGEQILGIHKFEDAVRIVRNAPQATQAAREIGPRVDAIPPMPGSGGHGGVATEQSLPFCTTGLAE
jgi:hypothetical protein